MKSLRVPLPEHCPRCGGDVELERHETQYQEEIVRRTVVRRFEIAVGRCRRCGRRVQGRHPLQTFDAVGVGSVQLGPEALTLAAVLNKQMGLSLGHTLALCRADRWSRPHGPRTQSSRSSHQRHIRVPAGPRCPTTTMR